MCVCCCVQAEDGIRDLVRSRGLGDVYKRQIVDPQARKLVPRDIATRHHLLPLDFDAANHRLTVAIADIDNICLLYTSDAADERSSVDLGGRRIIKKKNEASMT